ncbi:MULTISPECIES: hypothetical protein [unclassified Chitinophaga]|uniref:hypothetical protein n=1 Tax=unclassified Chitinophaga TaxID=2619133 RepID=UPI0015C2E7A6|nr:MULTISPECIES: hypothetical protein [unclassified Chitinophaga]WPV65293.1 hypothetical protein QQL36_26155 [Chitinophaga sp. LS1]
MANRVSSVKGIHLVGTIIEAIPHPTHKKKAPSQRFAGTFIFSAVLISKKDSKNILPQVSA